MYVLTEKKSHKGLIEVAGRQQGKNQKSEKPVSATKELEGNTKSKDESCVWVLWKL